MLEQPVDEDVPQQQAKNKTNGRKHKGNVQALACHAAHEFGKCSVKSNCNPFVANFLFVRRTHGRFYECAHVFHFLRDLPNSCTP